MTIRIGIIGAGIMGSDHARIFSTQIPGVVLQYICDSDAKRVKSIADETGAAHTSTIPFDVINAKDVDAIVIASPDETHAPLTTAALALAKPVLC